MTPQPAEQELIVLTQRLLDSIAAADWATYTELCDPSLSAFEPESRGYLIEGLDFHQFYFKLGPASGARHTTMVGPKVRLLGDAAVVTYVRLVQKADKDGVPPTAVCEETRVWHKQQGKWRHVHFHRSLPG